MTDIFISYRRQDSAGETRSLTHKLVDHFGQGSVFRDLEEIHAGDHFKNKIYGAVKSCKVMIVVIGPYWSKITDDKGVIRLMAPEDYVRKEIEEGLKLGIPIVPVVVNSAIWPPKEDLPDSLAGLLKIQIHELSDKQGRWDYDVQQLVQLLVEILDQPREASSVIEKYPGSPTKSSLIEKVLGLLGRKYSMVVNQRAEFTR